MPKLRIVCSVISCGNSSLVKKNKFFFFPNQPDSRRARWIKFAREGRENGGADWEPEKNASICFRHFRTGRPNASPLHVDYVPSIYKRTTQKRKADSELDREKKRVDCTEEKAATSSASSTTLPTHGPVNIAEAETEEEDDSYWETIEPESPQPSTSFNPDFY